MIERLPQYVIDKIAPEPNTGCWLWAGALTDTGYGTVWHRGSGRTFRAHRLVYALLREPIQAGLTLDHLCRVRCCVNPDHLEPVANRVNILRGTGPTARNAQKTHCAQGHPYDAHVRRGARECTTCRREQWRAWYAANHERRNGYRRAYTVANREELREQWRAYDAAHRERRRESARRYRERKAAQKLQAEVA